MSKKREKVIIIQAIRGHKSGTVVEVRPGYSRYLLRSERAKIYSDEAFESFQSAPINDKTKDYNIIAQYIDGMVLKFIRKSNKSQTLFARVRRNNVFEEMQNQLSTKVNEQILSTFKSMNPLMFIPEPDVTKGNQIHKLILQGVFEGKEIYLCIGNSAEQCEILAHKEVK